MSRIGKQPVVIPTGVTVTASGGHVTVKGPLGQLERELPSGISAGVETGKVLVTRTDDSRGQKSRHGLSRTLVVNMIQGVTKGYRKELIIEGTGFKAAVQGARLQLWLGFAAPKDFAIPAGIKVTEKQGVQLTIDGIDKEMVGDTTARIRGFYPAEPYKGKGIKYVGEQIRRKQGKTVA
ncbi:MAG: 50S ribosomal protein L6 [bacterium]